MLRAVAADVERSSSPGPLPCGWQGATTDPLTGALNRRRFFHRADEEFQAARRYGRALAFCMLHVDHFKRINDTHGHPQGDEVLRRLSRFCDGALRETDRFGRLGGEEFAVLFPETGLETATEVVERLRVGLARLEVPLADGSTLHFSISGGLAHLQPTDADVQALLQRADAALYRAKGTGRNRVVIG